MVRPGSGVRGTVCRTSFVTEGVCNESAPGSMPRAARISSAMALASWVNSPDCSFDWSDAVSIASRLRRSSSGLMYTSARYAVGHRGGLGSDTTFQWIGVYPIGICTFSSDGCTHWHDGVDSTMGGALTKEVCHAHSQRYRR